MKRKARKGHGYMGMGVNGTKLCTLENQCTGGCTWDYVHTKSPIYRVGLWFWGRGLVMSTWVHGYMRNKNFALVYRACTHTVTEVITHHPVAGGKDGEGLSCNDGNRKWVHKPIADNSHYSTQNTFRRW
jgi:hypothetical protein